MAERGVGIMLGKSVVSSVIGYWAISDRVLLVKIRGNPFNICIIQVYAPTSQHDEDSVNRFYDEVTKAKEQCKQHDIVLVMGDLNARVGNERIDDVVGPHGLGNRDDRGEKWVEWCIENNQIIGNTWFRHHARHLYTWKSPGDRSRSQIDYITINRRFRNSLLQVKTYPGADCDSDHVPVVATVRVRIKRIVKGKARPKPQVNLLRENENIKNQYSVEVKNRFEILQQESEDETAEQQWKILQEAISKANEIVLPKTERKEKKPWMTDEILKLMDERRIYKDSDREKYRSLNKRIHKECNKAKEKWMNDRCKVIEDLSKKDQQLMYEKLTEVTKIRSYQPGKAIKTADGKVVMETEEVKRRWCEYITELFMDERPENLNINFNDEGPPIMKEEVQAAIKTMKTGKAVGDDGISVEMLRALGDYAIDKLTDIANKIYDSGEVPSQMCKSIFIAIPKIQGTLECDKHRTISIMSQITKIMLKIILARVRGKITPQIGEEQFGFVKGKGTRNAIFAMRMLSEKNIEVDRDLYLCFVDYEKAFDKVKHEELIRMLQRINIDGKDLRIIKNLYWNQKAAVRIGNEESEYQSIKRGVRQGCVMSPDLFNLYSEIIMREIDHLEGVRLGGRNINHIRYADDTVLVADSNEKLQRLIEGLNVVSLEKGLKMNMRKTQTMVISRRGEVPRSNIRIDGSMVEQVDRFNYLGSLISSNGRCEDEIKRRINIAKSAYNRIKKLITNKKMSVHTRKRFVKCYVWSTLMYGCETWTMNKADERRIEAAEMWFWRRLLKISWTERISNEQVLERMNTPRELLKHIKQRQLRFVGHIMREQKLENMCLTGIPNGKRPKGRPRRTYMDGLVKTVGGGHSKASLLRATQNRPQWRFMVANV